MKIGYARVSTEEQHLDLQLAALSKAGCDTVLSDHGISGSRFDRPGLREALNLAQDSDTLIVWRLDRLGRSLSHLVDLVGGLGKRGIEFVSLTESIDTRSPTGMLMFHMIAALAEFERSLISERTRAGMAAARARGAKIGRPRRSSSDAQHARHRAAMLNFGAALPWIPERPAFGFSFLRDDWIPGHDNPCASHPECRSAISKAGADVIQRTRRRSDIRRIGRCSPHMGDPSFED